MIRQALSTIDGWPVEGAAAIVVRSGEAVGGHGEVDRRFALASVTKPLVALAVLVATEEGALGLDEPAGPPGATVRHLLAHAAGYAFDGYDGFDDVEPIAPVGVRRIYSNTGFERLGDHLADRTGMAVADYVTEAVLEPLEMSATALEGSPASGAVGSAADLGRLAAELLAPTLVSPDTLAEATSVQFPGLAGVLPGYGRQSPNDWGLGVEIRGTKSPHWTGTANSPATFGHFGAAGTFLWVDPVAGAGLVALTDRPFGPWAIDAWPPFSDAVLTALTA